MPAYYMETCPHCFRIVHFYPVEAEEREETAWEIVTRPGMEVDEEE